MIYVVGAMGILLGFIIGYYSFILPKEEILAYKLYELRDKVAYEVLKGNIDENDIVYIYMITLINMQISFIDGKIPYTEIFTSTLKVSKVNDEKYDDVITLIKSNEVLNEIYENVIEISKKIFHYKKYIIHYMYIKPVILFLNLCISVLNASKRIPNKEKRVKKQEIYEYKHNTDLGFGVLKRMLG